MKQLASTLLLLLIFAPAHAQDNAPQSPQEIRYIRDTLFVPLRSGQSNAYRIVHKGLKSGSTLQLLEENKESEYSRVKTSKGIEGWIQTQYLTAQPTARLVLNKTQRELNQLRNDSKPRQQKVIELEKYQRQAKLQIAQYKKEQSRLSDELAAITKISANAIEMDRNNKKLLKKSEMQKNEIDVLTADNIRLKDSVEQEAFINGALAVAFGVFLALIIPHLIPQKKRHSEWG